MIHAAIEDVYRFDVQQVYSATLVDLFLSVDMWLLRIQQSMVLGLLCRRDKQYVIEQQTAFY